MALLSLSLSGSPPSLSSSSRLFSLSLSPSSSLSVRVGSLGVLSRYTRPSVSPSPPVEKRLPLAHSFQASAAGKASDATSPDATPQSRTAVAACRCTFPVDAFSPVHTLSSPRSGARRVLYLKTCDATEPKGERINRTLCVPAFS